MGRLSQTTPRTSQLRRITWRTLDLFNPSCWRNKTHSEIITLLLNWGQLRRDKLPLFMPGQDLASSLWNWHGLAWIGVAYLSETVASPIVKLLFQNLFCFFSNCVGQEIVQLNLLFNPRKQTRLLAHFQGLLYHRTCKTDFLCSWPSLNSYLK